jgi:hypothetical protein
MFFFSWFISLLIFLALSLSSLLTVVVATVCCFQWYNYMGVNWYGENLQCGNSRWLWHGGEMCGKVVKNKGRSCYIGLQLNLIVAVKRSWFASCKWWSLVREQQLRGVRIDEANCACFFLWFLSFFFSLFVTYFSF